MLGKLGLRGDCSSLGRSDPAYEDMKQMVKDFRRSFPVCF